MSRARDLARKARDMKMKKESAEDIEEGITANTKYGRAHDNAMKLTDKAKKSRKIDHYVDAIKAHKEALKHAQSSTNKAAHSGHVRDLSKKLTMAEDVNVIDEADNFDKNFTKRISATVRGGKGAEYLKRKAKEYQDANPDKGKGIGPGVLNLPLARKKAAEKGVRPGSLRASPNTRNPKRLPEEVELGEEMMFKVSVEGLPDMVMIGNSPAQIKATLRKIVKQPSMIGDIDRMTKGEVKKRYRDMAQDRVEEAKSPNPEDNQPASPDEKSMAMKQAEFVGYVAKEIQDHLKKNKEFPEWMQNKLSAFHQKSKDMHSTLGAHGPDEKDDD
jgi:hypothetical protein